MSIQGVMCDRFTEELDKLVKEASKAGIHGLSIAEILQQATTKQMKECYGGDDDHDYDKALFEFLDKARQELVDAKPAAQKRMEAYRLIGRWLPLEEIKL